MILIVGIDMVVEKLKIMFKLQQSLNDETNGKNWELGVTKNGKKINWQRAIFMESAELIDSYPWKHWKSIDAKVDRENIKMESVDIWHFVMSEALRLNYLQNRKIGNLVDEVADSSAFRDYLSNKRDSFETIYDEIAVVEKFLALTLCKSDILALVDGFFEVAKVANLTFDELYLLYIGKNILNRFRQQNGYKEGKYIKIWEAREDNEVLQNILKSNPDITPEHLYLELESEYRKLKVD